MPIRRVSALRASAPPQPAECPKPDVMLKYLAQWEPAVYDAYVVLLQRGYTAARQARLTASRTLTRPG